MDAEEYERNKFEAMCVYTKIYGRPDGAARKFIAEAVRGKWTTGQILNYLRAQPEYQTTREYMARASAFARRMGL